MRRCVVGTLLGIVVAVVWMGFREPRDTQRHFSSCTMVCVDLQVASLYGLIGWRRSWFETRAVVPAQVSLLATTPCKVLTNGNGSRTTSLVVRFRPSGFAVLQSRFVRIHRGTGAGLQSVYGW